ncbi:non-specific serine/threonine protein kinase [Malassezia yamatoensis]|uniref:non-specific serine/threonine protein kinase n=1 Tax=Malassezia yamatoensis TaxID=253288 RepID=A0AAJ5YRX5_9BASI|nr:non-specific serine/threonine protein kinase [Malassezia yamatoensis]
MKRIADRQIQREDGEDPHAVDSEASDSQPKQDAAPQQRAIRGLPKRRAPGTSSPAVAQPIANPFASIGSTSTVKPGSEPQKTPAANPFANLAPNAPTAQQSLSVSASVPAFTFNTKGVQSQPESSNAPDNTEAQSTDRKSVSEKTDSRPLSSEKSRNDIEIYKNIRGLNWSFIRALVNSFNQSSDCANFAPVLSAFEQQYTQHYNTILQDQNRANLSTHSKADTKSATVQASENKGGTASLPSFGSSHPALFSRPSTSTALNAKAPSKDDIYPAFDNLHKRPETAPQSHKESDVINSIEDQHNDQKKKQSDSAASSTESPQAGLFGKGSFTSSAADGGANSNLSGNTQSKQAGEDAAQKRLAALSSMRDRNGSKASTSVSNESSGFAMPISSAAEEQEPKATSEANERSTLSTEKEKESRSSVNKPPTFSVSHGGFSFAGKSSSEILSSDKTVATNAPGAPTFSLPIGGTQSGALNPNRMRSFDVQSIKCEKPLPNAPFRSLLSDENSSSKQASSSPSGVSSRRAPVAASHASDTESRVERSKSTSSTSSANSTSSIEAAPFRAPPRGNLRGSNVPSINTTHVTNVDHPGQTSLPYTNNQFWTVDGTGASKVANPPSTSARDAPESPVRLRVEGAEESFPKPAPPLRGATPRIKHLVKPVSDAWIYRNGPGLSNVRRSPKPRPSVDDASSENTFQSTNYLASMRRISGQTGNANLTIDVPAMSRTSSAPAWQRPPSSASYQSRHSETVRDNRSVMSGGSDRLTSSGMERTASLTIPGLDEAKSMPLDNLSRSTANKTDYMPFHAITQPDSTQMTPAETVRLEAKAGVAELPDNPELIHAADDQGRWRSRTQKWIHDLQTTHISDPNIGQASSSSPNTIPRDLPRDSHNKTPYTENNSSKRDTNTSHLSDWTLDARRMQSLDISPSSSSRIPTPSPQDLRTDTRRASSSRSWRNLDVDTKSANFSFRPDSEDLRPIPSLSKQMGYENQVESTTGTLNMGIPPGKTYGNEVKLSLPSSHIIPPRTPPPLLEPGGSETSVSKRTSQRRRTPDDFVFGEVLGEGSYSTVLKAWDVHDLPPDQRQAIARRPSVLEAVAGKSSPPAIPISAQPHVYAVKVLDKVHILKEKKQKYVRVEKKALSLLLQSPGIVTLYFTFQDRESLYFVLKYAPNGEFLHYVKELGSLDTHSATFYAAQLADAIGHIHRAGIVHRDIKPENMLLDADMRILVTDFGSAKILDDSLSNAAHSNDAARLATAHIGNEEPPTRTRSFVGTAEYVSPELLAESATGMPSDWWAFACVIFQMLAGRSPFHAANEYQTFQRILHRQFTYPNAFPPEAKKLIDQLLVIDPDARPTLNQIQASSFFGHTDFGSIWSCTPPPMLPGLAPSGNASNGPSADSDGIAEVDSHFASFQRHHGMSSPSSNAVRSTSCDESGPSSSEDYQSQSNLHKHGNEEKFSETKTRKVVAPSSELESRRLPFNAEYYDDLMLPNEFVTFMSPIILRKTGTGNLFSKRCQLLLTTYPRLLCARESGKTIKVLCEVILRKIPIAVSNSSPADTQYPLERAASTRSGLRKLRSHSLRSRPSSPSLPHSAKSTRAHDLLRNNTSNISTDSLTRFASTGARAEQLLRHRILSKGEKDESLPRNRSDSSHSESKDPRYANWLMRVETRPPRQFLVHTVRFQHLRSPTVYFYLTIPPEIHSIGHNASKKPSNSMPCRHLTPTDAKTLGSVHTQLCLCTDASVLVGL